MIHRGTLTAVSLVPIQLSRDGGDGVRVWENENVYQKKTFFCSHICLRIIRLDKRLLIEVCFLVAPCLLGVAITVSSNEMYLTYI